MLFMTDSTVLSRLQRWLCVLTLLALTACTSPTKRADELARAEAWHEAVMELRKAAREHPNNVEVRSRLVQTELRAAEHFHARAMQWAAQGETSAAIEALQNGLSAAPTHEKLQQALASLLAQQEADSLHEEGQRLQALGSTALAMARWQLALQRMPGHTGAVQAIAEAREAGQGEADGLALSSRAPITLNFRQTDLRAAFEFLAKAFGINVIFDEGLRSAPVTLLARDVTFEHLRSARSLRGRAAELEGCCRGRGSGLRDRHWGGAAAGHHRRGDGRSNRLQRR
jgi:general secretion pathway protein D